MKLEDVLRPAYEDRAGDEFGCFVVVRKASPDNWAVVLITTNRREFTLQQCFANAGEAKDYAMGLALHVCAALAKLSETGRPATRHVSTILSISASVVKSLPAMRATARVPLRASVRNAESESPDTRATSASGISCFLSISRRGHGFTSLNNPARSIPASGSRLGIHKVGSAERASKTASISDWTLGEFGASVRIGFSPSNPR